MSDCFGAGRWRGCSSCTPARTAMSPTSSSRSTQSVSSWPFSPLASDHSRHSEYPAFSRLPVQKPDRNGSSSADVCRLAVGLPASSDHGRVAGFCGADASDGLGHAAARAVRELPLGLQLRRLPLLLARLQGPRQPRGAAVLRLGLDAVLRADGLRHGRPELLRRGAAEHVHDDGLRRDAVHAHAGGQQDRHGPGCERNHSFRICLCDLLTKNLQL